MSTIFASTFEQLREGDTFATDGRTVTEEDVLSFAEQTGDRHPQHVDAAWSASTRFGGRVAPGLLTLSYSFGLAEPDPDCVVGMRSMTDVVFVRPVRIGDTISASMRVTGLIPLDDDTGVVGITMITSNQDRKTVCRARVQMLWRRDAR